MSFDSDIVTNSNFCIRLSKTFEERGTDIPPEELDATIEALAYGAVKYADLKNNRTTNYK